MILGRSTCARARVRLGCVLGASWVVFRCVLGGSRSWEAHLSLPASFCCIKPQGPGRFLRLGSSSEPPSFLFLYWAPRPMGPWAHGPMVPYQRGIERNKSRRDIEVCRSCRCSRRPLVIVVCLPFGNGCTWCKHGASDFLGERARVVFGIMPSTA